MTDKQMRRELSADYLAWSEREGDCNIFEPVEEIERLCRVVVGLRAKVRKLKRERAGLGIREGR